MEVFIQISNSYFVGNKGTIRNLKGELSQKTKSNGYKEVCLYLDKKPVMKYVHRLVAEYFVDNIPKNYVVNHKDGDKSNNDVCNLEIVTYSENSIHSYHKLGNKIKPKKGEDHHRSKVKEIDVVNIRKRYDKGEPVRLIQKEYKNISLSSLRKICYRSTWKHIK